MGFAELSAMGLLHTSKTMKICSQEKIKLISNYRQVNVVYPLHSFYVAGAPFQLGLSAVFRRTPGMRPGTPSSLCALAPPLP
jgi:hypothetical protein